LALVFLIFRWEFKLDIKSVCQTAIVCSMVAAAIPTVASAGTVSAPLSAATGSFTVQANSNIVSQNGIGSAAVQYLPYGDFASVSTSLNNGGAILAHAQNQVGAASANGSIGYYIEVIGPQNVLVPVDVSGLVLVSDMCAAVTKSSTGAAAICGRGGVKSSQW
jgi:hypothetical protein